jgi:hypothetical protein
MHPTFEKIVSGKRFGSRYTSLPMKFAALSARLLVFRGK